jgi:hypothetical protein
MNQKLQVLSHDERSQLLLFALFLLLIITVFLGTAVLLVNKFPHLSTAMKIGNTGLSPDLGVFLSLILISIAIIGTLLRAVIQDSLEFSFKALLAISLVGLAGFLFSLYNSFKHGGFSHGLLLLGIFIVEGLLIAWGGVKLIDWFDSLYGDFPFSIRKGLTSADVANEMKKDSFIKGLIPKRK